MLVFRIVQRLCDLVQRSAVGRSRRHRDRVSAATDIRPRQYLVVGIRSIIGLSTLRPAGIPSAKDESEQQRLVRGLRFGVRQGLVGYGRPLLLRPRAALTPLGLQAAEQEHRDEKEEDDGNDDDDAEGGCEGLDSERHPPEIANGRLYRGFAIQVNHRVLTISYN